MPRRHLLFLAAGVLAVLAAVPVASAAINRGAESPQQTTVVAQSALGTGFTYQGRLTDDDAPANGIYDLRFILYDAESGGAQVGSTVEKANVQVQNGLFTTELDFGADAFDGDARWLEIAIRPGTESGNYTVLSPRQPITPVPYAIHADHAETAGSFELPFSGTGSSGAAAALLNILQSGAGIAINADADTGTAAKVSGATALEIDGPIKVSGNQAAFTVTADSGEFCDTDATPIDNDMVNGDATALLFLTLLGDTPAPLSVAYDVGEDCPADQWVIYGLADGAMANVLVIKQ